MEDMRTINEYKINELKNILYKVYSDIHDEYLIRVGIFGSCARGTQKKSSDLDIVLDFKELLDIDIFRKRYAIEDLVREEVKAVMHTKLDVIYWDDRLNGYGDFQENIEREVVWVGVSEV